MDFQKRILICMTAALFALPSNAQHPEPAAIIKKSEEKNRGKIAVFSEMTIQVKRPKWTRELQMKAWQKGTKYSMLLITSPAKERGTAFLKRNKEVWSYMPSIERAVKMPPSMMMRSWMGTDFTNDDLVKESSLTDDYDQELSGDSLIREHLCYKITLTPKPDAAVVWGKIVLFIDQKDYIQYRSEMYDEDGFLVHVMNASETKWMGGRKIASKMVLTPVDKKESQTVLLIRNILFDQPEDDAFFTVQNMRKLK